MPIQTVEGKALLGWMPRDEAIKFLTKACLFEPQLSETEAVSVWDGYRRQVEALPERTCSLPQRLKIKLSERREIDRFINAMRRRQITNVSRVVKINPDCLVLHQFVLALHRCGIYLDTLKEKHERVKTCLGMFPENQLRQSWIRQDGQTTIVRLPHAEFECGPSRQGGLFIRERPRYITLVELGDRCMLWSGYHRSYAVLNHISQDATGSPAIFAVLMNPVVGDAGRFLGVDSLRPTVRDALRGKRPALVSDFFNNALCMNVTLRKQHPEFHIVPWSQLLQRDSRLGGRTCIETILGFGGGMAEPGLRHSTYNRANVPTHVPSVRIGLPPPKFVSFQRIATVMGMMYKCGIAICAVAIPQFHPTQVKWEARGLGRKPPEV